nr:hypothetical protein [Rickettsia tillamookensis]
MTNRRATSDIVSEFKLFDYS